MALQQLKAVYDIASAWPATVQNRFLRREDYDCDLQVFCFENLIMYQAFSILRSNSRLLSSNLVRWLAEITSVTTEEALLNLVLSIGTGPIDSLCILNGTKAFKDCGRILHRELPRNSAAQLYSLSLNHD